MQYIFRSTGIYIGFVANGTLFTRDGEYLGWVEGPYAWDASGRFRGQFWGDGYLIVNRFAVPPVPKLPRVPPSRPMLPNPPPNRLPVALPTGWQDAF